MKNFIIPVAIALSLGLNGWIFSSLQSANQQVKEKTFEISTQKQEINHLSRELKKSEHQIAILRRVKKARPTESKGDIPKIAKKTVYESEKSNTTTYTITAYTNNVESTGKTPKSKSYGITASGEQTKAGYTISCPPEMKFGTKVNIETVGVRVCTDRGSAITGKHIDLYIPSLQEALKFGKQQLKITVEE